MSTESPESTGVGKVFIVGLPRSGTTWMMWLLAQHAEVVALQQSGMFLPIKRLEEWWVRDHRFSRGLAGLSDAERAALAEGAPSYVMDGTSRVVTPRDFYEQARSMLSVMFDRVVGATPGARMVVDQTPEHMEFAPLIRAVFPDAYFLHVVRDPRAVCGSMRKALESWADPSGFPHTPVHIARGWNRFVQLGRQIGTTTDRYHMVRYEDLSADADGELERIHAWLGLRTDAEVRRAAIDSCKIDKLRAHTQMPEGFFRRGTAGGWEGDLSGSELRTIEYITREEMVRHGYEPQHPKAHVKPLRLTMYELAQTAVTSPARKALFQGSRRQLRGLERTVQLMRDFKLVRY